MLSTLVAVQAGHSLCANGVGRDHALDGIGHSQVAVLSHQLAVLNLLQAADVLAVGDVELLLSLVAGQHSLVAVHDNDEIAAVHVGGIIDLLLAAQQNSSLSSDVAQRLAGSVEQIPLALDFSGLYESSAHIYFLLISFLTFQASFSGRVCQYTSQKETCQQEFSIFSAQIFIALKIS